MEDGECGNVTVFFFFFLLGSGRRTFLSYWELCQWEGHNIIRV